VWIVALTFVLVLAIVLGMYWLFVQRPEQSAEAAIRRRLTAGRPTHQIELTVQRAQQRLSSMATLDKVLASRARLVAPVEQLLEQAGVKATVGVFLLSTACLAGLGILAGQLVAGALWVGVLLGACLACVPYLYLKVKRNRRVKRFEELFPEALDLMARAMRAGHTFITAINMVADELPEPIAGEFKLLHDQQNFGMPLNEALRNFGERVPLLAAKFFVTAILTQRESGGNLTEVLDNLASVIRDRFNVQRQVQIRSAHGKMTGFVLVGLPPALALALSILNPNHFAVMLGDAFGVQMIVGAIVLQIAGALIIRKIVNIEY
jgi:tight adherence protein B